MTPDLLERFEEAADHQASKIVTKMPQLRAHRRDISRDLVATAWREYYHPAPNRRTDIPDTARAIIAMRWGIREIIELYVGRANRETRPNIQKKFTDRVDTSLPEEHSNEPVSSEPTPEQRAMIREVLKEIYPKMDMRDRRYWETRAYDTRRRLRNGEQRAYGDNVTAQSNRRRLFRDRIKSVSGERFGDGPGFRGQIW